MNWITTRIKGIMLTAAVLTGTTFWMAVAPQAGLQNMFGEALDGPLADIIVRDWGGKVALIAGMLVYGAYNPQVRRLVLTVASIGKIVFVSLILSHGTRYLGQQAAIAVVVDTVLPLLFIAYLVAAPRTPSGA